MRYQLLKLKKNKSTKSERIFSEILKELHIPFRTKIKIKGREIDFLIGNYVIDIDCHAQDQIKNKMLVECGYNPIHFTNQEIKNNLNSIKLWLEQIFLPQKLQH